MNGKNLPKYFEYNKVKIPSIGLGTAYMSNVSEVVFSSIKDGVRLIDTAAVYGTEKGVGKGIKKAIDQGIVKREDLFIVTKLSKFDIKNPELAIKNSLKMLGLNYIDLYLLHWPKFFDYEGKVKKTNIVPMHVIWPNMENLVTKGYTKYIGVSNFNVQSLLNLLSFCVIPPLVNEIEFHPYLYQKKLAEFCKRENIILLGYNPLLKDAIQLNQPMKKIETYLEKKL